jgi:hypothetical protein
MNIRAVPLDLPQTNNCALSEGSLSRGECEGKETQALGGDLGNQQDLARWTPHLF